MSTSKKWLEFIDKIGNKRQICIKNRSLQGKNKRKKYRAGEQYENIHEIFEIFLIEEWELHPAPVDSE